MINRFRSTSPARFTVGVTLAAVAITASARADFFNGFEVDASGWTVFGGALNATRVASGTNGVTSKTGAFHAEVLTGATNWGGYSQNPGCAATACAAATFPVNGYTTSVDIYLNVAGGWANDTRFDWGTAINLQTGGHRRDFIFNAGFYNDTDGSPGSGTNRFIVSASTNSQPGSAFAKNTAMGPIAISTSGWYTFQHRFYDNGGVLECEMKILDAGGTTVNTWVRSDAADLIATIIGGNRYGWFDYNQFPFLAIDNSRLRTPVVKNLNTGETFFAIQDAINDSDTVDGHVLKMLVTSHAEGPQIQFTKSLTLQGTGVESVRALGDTANPYCGCNGRAWILVSAGEVCHFEDLEFHGNGYRVADGIRFLGSGAVTRCRFRDIKFNPSGGEYAGRAIACVGDAPTNVTYCDLAQCGRIGMYWYGPAVNGSLCQGNVYVGKGVGDWLDYGVEVEGGAAVTLSGNTITNCLGVASVDSSTSGAVLATTYFAPGTHINAFNNTIRDNTYGLALGYDPGDTTTCTANYNSFVNNVVAVDHTNVAALVNAENNWWGSASGPEDLLGSDEASVTTCFAPATMVNADGTGDAVSDLNVDYCPWLLAPASLSINPVSVCNTGTSVVVKIRMSQVKDFVVGGQFFLSYDNTRLDFISAAPGSFPFSQEIYEVVNEGAGTIDYAVGVLAPHPGTPADTDMVVLTFDRIGSSCALANLVAFRAHAPPTRLTNVFGDPINPLLNNLPAITIDSTPPTITCPANITVNADAGLCSAAINVGTATAVDNCTASPSVVGIRSDSLALNDPYPAGITTITWTATDGCGNASAPCQQLINVNASNTMMVDIAYDGGFAGTNFTRCIRFELFTCPSATPVIVDQNVNFVNGQALNVAVNVPCGLYDCVTARDRKHTLRKTDGGFGIVGVVYDANFTSGDALIGGNLNDDQFIDILDFGIFVGQYNATPSPSTPCGYVGNHADISGNGIVTVGDYSFITNNFLQSHEANCCGAPRMTAGGSGGAGGPVTRISVKELMRRGMRDVIAGDLNQDGWVDTADVQFFMSGGSTGGSR